MEKTEFACIAIICLTIVMIIALYTGHNGVFLASVLAILGATIGGIIGFEVGIKKK